MAKQAAKAGRSWEPGDVIRMRAYSGGFRVWRVSGVFLGGEHQESVIEIETLDRDAPTKGRMYVPVELIDAAAAKLRPPTVEAP